ncbi:hypothetical protein ABT391_23170 [Streptomyces jumonjinensis]|uniref:Uncharacterized protein n=2 Tax=Streptomyces jumonjinensis TaxID=1945 RepID=A0A646KS87_STRJU|nr:hypothetical protein [Streptomyces jumonjinensis]
MTTTAGHLQSIAQLWPDLQDALGGRTQSTWPPVTLHAYLAALDAEEIEAAHHRAAALRQLERSPDQIGVRPVPIRLAVHDTMRMVETVLVQLADQIAANIQRSPLTDAPRSWPAADRARRDALARADREHPHRWRYTGTRTAPQAALWLWARVEQIPGPCRPLTAQHQQRIATIAQGAADRIERVLDTGTRTAVLDAPCPDCSGRLTVTGGAGTTPIAHCTSCGRTWTTPTAAA